MHPTMLIFHGVLTCLLFFICYTDGSRYRIPNAVIGMLLVLYPAMVLTTPVTVPWIESVALLIGVFLVCFAMFNANVVGGGDAKLLSACALWTGMQTFAPFVVWMSLYGGVLTLGLIIIRRMLRRKRARTGDETPLHPALVVGAQVPYGIAIALGFLTVLWMGQISGLAVPWDAGAFKLE